MKQEVLSPAVQDGKEADLGAEVFGVRRDGFQSLGGGPEENAVDSLLVLESDRGNLFRHGEDDMKVRDLKKFGLAILKPLSAGKGLTFWAMAIPARNGVNSITCLGLNRYAVFGGTTFRTLASGIGGTLGDTAWGVGPSSQVAPIVSLRSTPTRPRAGSRLGS